VQVDLAIHAIARAVIGKPGDIDLADAPDAELECIALPHAVDMTPLESFTGWLGFCLNPNEKSMFFENTMDCSLGTGKVESVFDTTGSPRRIFLFEPDNPLFQRW